MSVKRDVDAELRFHFESRVEELVAGGMSEDSARTQANSEFGDVSQVRSHLVDIDARVARRRDRVEIVRSAWQDVAYAARSLRRAPAVSLTIILTLMLGIGANAAIFSFLDVLFLRAPAAIVAPAQLRRVWQSRQFRDAPQYWSGFDYQTFVAIGDAIGAGGTTFTYKPPTKMPTRSGENAPTLAVSGTSAKYFGALGLRPQLGRFYSETESRPENPSQVAVISDALWRSTFDASPSAIGKQLTLSAKSFTIIGVAPATFSGVDLNSADVWIPLGADLSPNTYGRDPWWHNGAVNGFQIVTRLSGREQPSVLVSRIDAMLALSPETLAQKAAEAEVIFGSIVAANGPGLPAAETQIAVRMAGVSFIVLLIACANVVNLLLARAAKRSREIAVRVALGVSRRRLVRMLVIESTLLSVVASIAALAAAVRGTSLLQRFLLPDVHFANQPLHWKLMVCGLVAAAVVGVVVGFIPAWRASSPDLTGILKAGGREGSLERSRLRDALVIGQAALSVVLLTGAALFLESLRNVKTKDIGYDVDRVAFADIIYETKDSLRDARMLVRLEQVLPRLAALPGVERASLTSLPPKYGFSMADYTPDVDTTGLKKPGGFYTAVTPDFFATVGTRILRGTTFSSVPGSDYSVVVNEEMAKALWPRQNPIGHCIRFAATKDQCTRVVGVVQTALLLGIKDDAMPQFYVPIDHPPTERWRNGSIVLRVADSQRVAAIKAADKLLRVEFPGGYPRIRTMEQTMAKEYRPWQLGAILFTLFGALALIVAVVGIYSTVTYAVAQRTHEFGVRIALGALTSDVVRLVVGESMRVVAIGVGAGVVLALMSGRLIASLLYDVKPTDATAMAAVTVVLLSIAALAAAMPAWRASRADPVSALRSE